MSEPQKLILATVLGLYWVDFVLDITRECKFSRCQLLISINVDRLWLGQQSSTAGK